MATESTATAPDVTASFRSDSDRSCSCAARRTHVSVYCQVAPEYPPPPPPPGVQKGRSMMPFTAGS